MRRHWACTRRIPCHPGRPAVFRGYVGQRIRDRAGFLPRVRLMFFGAELGAGTFGFCVSPIAGRVLMVLKLGKRASCGSRHIGPLAHARHARGDVFVLRGLVWAFMKLFFACASVPPGTRSSHPPLLLAGAQELRLRQLLNGNRGFSAIRI